MSSSRVKEPVGLACSACSGSLGDGGMVDVLRVESIAVRGLLEMMED